MTKSTLRQKFEKKIIKKKRNEKLNFIHNEDWELNSFNRIESRSRIPSNQQYRKLKKKKNVEQIASAKIKKGKMFSSFKDKLEFPDPIFQSNNDCSSIVKRLRKESISSSSTFTFNIQPEWSEFEDMDNFRFVSEEDFDMSNIFQILKDHQSLDFDTLENLSVTDELTDNINCWKKELSDDQLEKATNSVNYIEQTIRTNFYRLFQKDYDLTVWLDILTKSDDTLAICESNKYIIYELLNKDYSLPLQQTNFKWTNLTSRCFSLKCCLEVIIDAEISKNNFNITLKILLDQCFSMLEHGIRYSPLLITKITDGIKKMLEALKYQHQRIEVNLCELIEDYKSCYVNSLDELHDAIIQLETFSDKSLNSVKDILENYLDQGQGGISKPEPVHQSFSVWLEQLKSFVGVLNPNFKSQSFIKIPFKMIMLLFLSFMCLFGNLEIERNFLISDYVNGSLPFNQTGVVTTLQLNYTPS